MKQMTDLGKLGYPARAWGRELRWFIQWVRDILI